MRLVIKLKLKLKLSKVKVKSMIIKSKLEQVEQIKKYIESNNNLYNKLVIYGVCTTPEGTDKDYLGVAVQTIDNSLADNDDGLLDLFCAVDDITEGKFDLVIINSRNTRNIANNIKKGELLYG